MNTEIEYAMQDGKLVHISEVARGLECNCVCPGCGGKMIARKGEKIAHHFSHQNAECEHGYETMLHIMAKSILEQEKKILLPPVTVDVCGKFSQTVYSSKLIDFNEIHLEKRIDDIIPDVLIVAGKSQLILEIYVTHKVDDEKLNKIKSVGISTLEIDLSQLDRTVTFNELKRILIDTTDYKEWIYNKFAVAQKPKYDKWFRACERKEVYYRKDIGDNCVYNCPLKNGKNNCEIDMLPCHDCGHLVWREACSKPDKYKPGKFYDYTVNYCGAKVKKSDFI